MGWTKTKNANVVELLKSLTRLQHALMELRAHHQIVRLGLQTRMLAADEDRASKRRKIWAGKAGTSKTPLQSKH